MDDVETVILSALTAKINHRPQLADAMTHLSIDSLSMAELALEIEQKLHIRLDERLLEQNTVGDLVSYARSLVEKQHKVATGRRT